MNLNNLYPERNLQDFKRQFPHANKIYYQINPDNKDEYRTIYCHLNVFNSNLTPRYSNYIQGTPPPNLEPMSPHLLSSIMRYNSLQNQPFYQKQVLRSTINICVITRHLLCTLSSKQNQFSQTLLVLFYCLSELFMTT